MRLSARAISATGMIAASMKNPVPQKTSPGDRSIKNRLRPS